MAEQVSHQSENTLGNIATSLQVLRQPIFSGEDGYGYSRYFTTDTGGRVYRTLRQLPELITNPQAVSELNTTIRKNAVLARDVLRGIESPKDELQREMQYLAERVHALVPQNATDQNLRRRDLKELEAQQVNAFGEGMATLLEEIINGSDEQGHLTHAVVLHRIARYGLAQLPQTVKGLAFAKGQDGRIHFNRQEIAAVTNLRDRRAITGAINLATGGLLKDGEEPVSAYRGVKAIAGKIGRGLLSAYTRLEDTDEITGKKATNAHKWLTEHDNAFDPKIARALGWGEKANGNVRQVNDILQFTQYEMPHHLSRVINAIPTDEQLAKIGGVIRATVDLGITGLSPLLELPVFNQPKST